MDWIAIHIVEFFRSSYDVLYVFTFIVAAFLLLSGLDDLTIDLFYWYEYLFRPEKSRQYENLSEEELQSVPEKPIAVFVPAWDEDGVVDRMLADACSNIRYENYNIFVGVYPNDQETLGKVRAVAQKFPRIHVVVGGHDGPTTKADNLNQIHEGMLKYENRTGILYDIIVMHDAEDMIHPMSLKVINYFVPQFDMVQLPVFPLKRGHKQVIHWTYCDEFAENHTKDLVARQLLSSFTPSAGVGTGYNRWLIEFAGTSYARNIFRNSALTEDYDIALRLALADAKLLYLYKPFGVNVSTRAYFPETIKTAVRQKTRWLIGICLQAWREYGWAGNLAFRFTLYHDRKAVFSNLLNVLAYVVLIYILLYQLAQWGLANYGELVPLVSSGTLLWYIIVADTGLMLWRFLHRFVTVSRVYGHFSGLLSILRFPIGNVVNFLATMRGISQYIFSVRNNTKLAWEKTHHTYPGSDEPIVY